MKLTNAQKRALQLIVRANGGVVQNNGTVLCKGDDGSDGHAAALHSVTWLRLVAMGLIAGDKGRLVPTIGGVEAAKQV